MNRSRRITILYINELSIFSSFYRYMLYTKLLTTSYDIIIVKCPIITWLRTSKGTGGANDNVITLRIYIIYSFH